MASKVNNSKVRFTTKNNRNYCHLIVKKDFFHDTFAYIDTADRLIENIMQTKGLKGEISKEIINPNSPYRIFFIRCTKRNSNIFRNEVFPKLHHKIAHKMGNNYLNYCEYIFNELMRGYN